MSWRDMLPAEATVWSWPEDRAPHPEYGRAGWGEGPWTDEPDKISWTDPTTGHPCLIHRGPQGALCGYVAVDPGHPLHGVDAPDADNVLAVHGGITYTDRCADTDDESFGICHVPAPGAPHDVWWLGFHCACAWDVTPGFNIFGWSERLMADCTYRDVAYVIEQCQLLALQLTGMAQLASTP